MDQETKIIHRPSIDKSILEMTREGNHWVTLKGFPEVLIGQFEEVDTFKGPIMWETDFVNKKGEIVASYNWEHDTTLLKCYFLKEVNK